MAQDLMKTVGGRIRALREKESLTQQDIAKIMGMSRAGVAQWELNVTSVSIQKAVELAKLLHTTPQFLAFGIDGQPKIEYIERPDSARIPEVMFGAKPTEVTELRNWTVPQDYLKGELHVLSTENLIIWRVEGSDMAPSYEYGDKVIVDMNAKRPSPSGIFLVWDGVGPALRNVAVVPVGGKPTARVATLDGKETFEVAIDKLTIIGRARGVLKNL